MTIRKAFLGDAHSIAEIHTCSWRNTYQNTLSATYLADIVPRERTEVWENRLNYPKPNQYVAVAENEGEIVAFACVYYGENSKWGSYLDNLHVHKDHQSKGIGTLLLFDVAKWCYQQKPTAGMCLLVNQDNITAQGFYKSLGARSAEESVWNAPDGSVVPTYWFVWDDIGILIQYG